jgi:uncharacterized RDD family membrane protein YckC
MWAASFAVNLVFGLGGGLMLSRSPAAMGAFFAGLAFSLVLPVIYNTVMVGRFGATLGKMACGLQVVGPDGEPISYGRALGRTVAEWLSGIICWIGYIMVAFDEEKRSLHDRIASTRVIIKSR